MYHGCNHTFSPTITHAGRAHQHRPLQERSSQVIEAKNRRLEKLTQEAEAKRAREMTFSPKINSNRRDQENIPPAHVRLYHKHRSSSVKARHSDNQHQQSQPQPQHQTTPPVANTKLQPYFVRHSSNGEMNYCDLHLCLCSMGLFKSLAHDDPGDAPSVEASKKVLTDKIWSAMTLGAPTSSGFVTFESFEKIIGSLLASRNSQPAPLPVQPSPVPIVEEARVAISPKVVRSRSVAEKQKCPLPKRSPSRVVEPSSRSRSSPGIDLAPASRSRSSSMSWQSFSSRTAEEQAKITKKRQQSIENAEIIHAQECTFKPTINMYAGPPDNAPPATSREERSALKSQYFRAMDDQSKAECTFHPQVHEVPHGIYQEPVAPAPGFSKAIQRMAKGRQISETHKKFEDVLRSGKRTSSSTPSRTQIVPFQFQTDRRERAKPLVYIDVNLGSGKVGRIGIHKGDKPDVLAQNFAQAYGLDYKMKVKLQGILTEHVQQVKTGASPVPSEKKKVKRIPGIGVTKRSSSMPTRGRIPSRDPPTSGYQASNVLDVVQEPKVVETKKYKPPTSLAPPVEPVRREIVGVPSNFGDTASLNRLLSSPTPTNIERPHVERARTEEKANPIQSSRGMTFQSQISHGLAPPDPIRQNILDIPAYGSQDSLIESDHGFTLINPTKETESKPHPIEFLTDPPPIEPRRGENFPRRNPPPVPFSRDSIGSSSHLTNNFIEMTSENHPVDNFSQSNRKVENEGLDGFITKNIPNEEFKRIEQGTYHRNTDYQSQATSRSLAYQELEAPQDNNNIPIYSRSGDAFNSEPVVQTNDLGQRYENIDNVHNNEYIPNADAPIQRQFVPEVVRDYESDAHVGGYQGLGITKPDSSYQSGERTETTDEVSILPDKSALTRLFATEKEQNNLLPIRSASAGSHLSFPRDPSHPPASVDFTLIEQVSPNRVNILRSPSKSSNSQVEAMDHILDMVRSSTENDFDWCPREVREF